MNDNEEPSDASAGSVSVDNRRDEMLWIVGKALGDPDRWEFQGVFDSEEQAVAACATQPDGTVDMFVGPAKLNAAVASKKRSWPGAYYPFTKRKRRAK